MGSSRSAPQHLAAELPLSLALIRLCRRRKLGLRDAATGTSVLTASDRGQVLQPVGITEGAARKSSSDAITGGEQQP